MLKHFFSEGLNTYDKRKKNIFLIVENNQVKLTGFYQFLTILNTK